jgi:nitroreductase
MRQILRRAKAVYNIAADFTYDAKRYFTFSQSGRYDLGKEQLEARILQKAHSIEKGLSLPEVRPWFGKEALSELCARMSEYLARGFDVNDPIFRKGGAAIAAYRLHHGDRRLSLPAELRFIEQHAAEQADANAGGVMKLTAREVRARARGDFADVALSRHSVRMFAPGHVSDDEIREAVRLAQKSPSVCNRQSSSVAIVRSPRLKAAALEIQGGNRGFSEQISCLIVVSGTLSAFRDARERNQVWVDGGLFSMSLMFALHFQGLGCCPLNWSAERQRDRALRRLLRIPQEQAIIMLLAVGHLREEYEVASSPRRKIESAIRVIE